MVAFADAPPPPRSCTHSQGVSPPAALPLEASPGPCGFYVRGRACPTGITLCTWATIPRSRRPCTVSFCGGGPFCFAGPWRGGWDNGLLPHLGARAPSQQLVLLCTVTLVFKCFHWFLCHVCVCVWAWLRLAASLLEAAPFGLAVYGLYVRPGLRGEPRTHALQHPHTHAHTHGHAHSRTSACLKSPWSAPTCGCGCVDIVPRAAACAGVQELGPRALRPGAVCEGRPAVAGRR
jgi:hypothetical protein